MKMALKDGKVLIKDADSTQGAVIRSWNRMRWNKSLKLFEGDNAVYIGTHLFLLKLHFLCRARADENYLGRRISLFYIL